MNSKCSRSIGNETMELQKSGWRLIGYWKMFAPMELSWTPFNHLYRSEIQKLPFCQIKAKLDPWKSFRTPVLKCAWKKPVSPLVAHISYLEVPAAVTVLLSHFSVDDALFRFNTNAPSLSSFDVLVWSANSPVSMETVVRVSIATLSFVVFPHFDTLLSNEVVLLVSKASLLFPLLCVVSMDALVSMEVLFFNSCSLATVSVSMAT